MIYGLLIGIGIILPGVSGGVIAVVLGVYDKIIYALNNFKKDKKEILFLIKLVIGLSIGVILSANLLKHFFDIYYVEMSYLFIGLVFGTIPFLLKENKQKKEYKINYVLLITIMIISFILPILLKDNIAVDESNKIILFISGILFAIGKIIPGISSSILLNLVGEYRLYLKILSNPINYIILNLFDTTIILLGFIIGMVLSIKLISYFLKNYYNETYSIIIGFTIGSTSVMYPGIINFPGIMFLLIGLVVSLGIPTIKK